MLNFLVLAFMLVFVLSAVLGVVQQHRWYFYEHCLKDSGGVDTEFE